MTIVSRPTRRCILNSNDIAGQAAMPYDGHSYPGFIAFMSVPAGSHLFSKNIRLWRDDSCENIWFAEPLPYRVQDTVWTERIFSEQAAGVLYHRGALNFVAAHGSLKIERRDTAAATLFGNSKERSILDLGHYIGGMAHDGTIVFQAGVEAGPP